jgi:hypothetical protein
VTAARRVRARAPRIARFASIDSRPSPRVLNLEAAARQTFHEITPSGQAAVLRPCLRPVRAELDALLSEVRDAARVEAGLLVPFTGQQRTWMAGALSNMTTIS